MTPRREILFVSSNFPPVIGGSSIVYDQLCRNASSHIVALGASQNHDSREPWPRLTEHDETCGYIIHRLPHLRPPASHGGPGRLNRLAGLLLDDLPVMLRTLAFITLLIVRYRVKTVCLGELLFGGWLIFPLRYLLCRKVILYTHGEEISQEDGSILGRMRKLFLEQAHAIISVSLFCKSQIVSLYAIEPTKIHVVFNGVDLETFRRDAADPAILPAQARGKRIILSISRLVERKGQEQLVRALPLVLRHVPEAHCLIVGDGPLASRLKAVAAEMNLGHACSFLGSVPQETLLPLYRCSDVFALPCRTLADGDTEGFGLVFLEANACGVPVVAGAAGGTIEAVIDDQTGLVVDGADPSEIADALIKILSDETLAQRLAADGWQRTQGCGWPQVTEEFLRICRIAPSRPSPHAHAPLPAAFADIDTPQDDSGKVRPRLLVTVDVEEEFDWSTFSRHGHKIHAVDALADYHERCRSIGITPVYCVTYAIMTDPTYADFFRQIRTEGSVEIGIHLHPWTTPPFWETPNVYNSYQCNLPEHIERRKLKTLCRTFEERFGTNVTIHRAGRWGGNARTATMLAEFGIKVDLSPSTGYSDPSNGGPDFRNLDGRPFWNAPDHDVLTIPASAINYLRGPRWVSSLFFSSMERLPWIDHLSKVLDVGKPVRFSPESETTDGLRLMARQFALRGLPVAVYSLHSTSLCTGGTPYVSTALQAADLRARSVEVLRQLVESRELSPSSCADIYQKAKETICPGHQFT